MEALDALAKMGAGKVGGQEENQNAIKTIDNNIYNRFDRESPTGTSAAATMRRLAKDVPALHELVLLPTL